MFEGSGVNKDSLKLIKACSRSDYFSDRDLKAIEFATAIQNCARASDSKDHNSRFNNRRGFRNFNRNYRSGSFRGGYNNYNNRDKDSFDGVVAQATKL